MNAKEKEAFPMAKHSWNQWFSAAFVGKSEKASEALKVLYHEAQKNRGMRALLNQLSLSLDLIAEETLDTTCYDDCPETILLKEHNLVGSYASFRMWKKTRYLVMPKVLPTYVALTGSEVLVTVKGPDTVVTHIESNEIIGVKHMEEVISTHVKNLEEKCVIYNNPTALLISELAQVPIEKAQNLPAKQTPVEEKCSVNTVINFINNLKDEVYLPEYVKKFKQVVQTKQTDIPITRNTEDGKNHILLGLPNLTKTFMNPSKIVHNQDIAVAVVDTLGVEVIEQSSVKMLNHFMTSINAKPEEQPQKLLYTASWLDKVAFEKYAGYCPIYTGLKGTPWILNKMKDYPSCKNKETFKLVLSTVIKMVKFYALWIRGGLAPTALGKYVEEMLRLSDKAIYGRTIRINLAVWCKPVTFSAFKETSVINVREDLGMFDDTPGDFKAMYDGEYKAPSFDFDPRSNMSDRDDDLPSDGKRIIRGANNVELKKAIASDYVSGLGDDSVKTSDNVGEDNLDGDEASYDEDVKEEDVDDLDKDKSVEDCSVEEKEEIDKPVNNRNSNARGSSTRGRGRGVSGKTASDRSSNGDVGRQKTEPHLPKNDSRKIEKGKNDIVVNKKLNKKEEKPPPGKRKYLEDDDQAADMYDGK